MYKYFKRFPKTLVTFPFLVKQVKYTNRTHVLYYFGKRLVEIVHVTFVRLPFCLDCFAEEIKRLIGIFELGLKS